MTQTIAVKRVGDAWEGALITDGRLDRSLMGTTLEEVALKGIMTLLSTVHDDGTLVVFDIRTETADEAARARSLQDATKAEQEASAELAKIELLKTTREKIRAAREALKNG